MSTSFPTSLDSYSTLVDNVDDVIAAHPNDRGDAIEALEAKVGVDSSAVTSSLDYKVKNIPTQTGTTKVTNLNADLLDGLEGAAYWPARSGDLMLSSSAITPTGWSDVSATYNNKFLRISSGTALSTGGADTHTHTAGSLSVASHTHSYSGTTSALTGSLHRVDDNSGGSDFDWMSPNSHTHTYSGTSGGTAPAVSGSTASGNNVPAYIQTKMYKKT